MKKTGRPTLLNDDDARNRVLKSLRVGNTLDVAAADAGIGARTLKTWLSKGRDGIEPYAHFRHDVTLAKKKAEAGCIRTIKRASRKHWQAAAWLVERRNPKRWARPELRLPMLAQLGASGAVSPVDFEKFMEAQRAKWREEWEREEGEKKKEPSK